MATVFTIGHGARRLDEFLSILQGGQIELLVDVRRYPGSRRHPHFSRDSLDKSLGERGIAYEWWGETLGGRRRVEADDRHVAWRIASFRAYAAHMDTSVFRDSLASLEARAARSRLAIMCAETLWWKCHRRLIADALAVDGFEVVHLGLGDERKHILTGSARVLENGLLLYDGAASGRSHPGRG